MSGNWNVNVLVPGGAPSTAGLPEGRTPEWYMQQVGPAGYRFVSAMFVDAAGHVLENVNAPVDYIPTGAAGSSANTTTNIPPPAPVRVAKGASTKVVNTLVDLSAALDQGWAPVRSNGTLMVPQVFQGGWLADGHPLNVILGQGWIAGQKEALAPFIANGQIPQPYLMVDAPELDTDGAMDWMMPIAAAAGVGVLLFAASRRRKNG